ncbi:MAG: hypothetical protein LBD48_06310 [Treponema sp.]|jgi:hypothetical protein|nr:hypothetical protein [Treponema sp.]
MKKLPIYAGFVFLALLISSCTTTETWYKDNMKRSEESLVYEENPNFKRTPLFSFSGDILKLEYRQPIIEFRVLHYNKVRTYYERDRTWYLYDPVDGKERVTGSEVIDTQVSKDPTGGSKVEKRVPVPGSQVTISIDGANINTVSSKDGAAVLDETAFLTVAQAAKSTEALKKVRVEVPSLQLAGIVDFMKAGFIAGIVSRTQEQIASIKKPITNPSSYETFIKALIAYKDKLEYPWLIFVLYSEMESAGNNLLASLDAEKAPVSDDFPEFVIGGKVEDYIEGTEGTTFLIWGTTVPKTMTEKTMRSLGFRNERSNLWVAMKNSTKNSSAVQWQASTILIQGKVYYRGRDMGKNASGDSVPVFYYTDDLSKVPNGGTEAGRKLQNINAQIASVKELWNKYNGQFK